MAASGARSATLEQDGGDLLVEREVARIHRAEEGLVAGVVGW